MTERKSGSMLRLSWKNVIIGAGTGIGAILVAAAVMASLSSGGVIEVEWLDHIAAAILVIGAVSGALAAGRGGGTAVDTAAAACCLWLMLLCINGIFYGLEFHGAWVGLLLNLGGAGAVMLVSKGPEKRPARRRRKYRHR